MRLQEERSCSFVLVGSYNALLRCSQYSKALLWFFQCVTIHLLRNPLLPVFKVSAIHIKPELICGERAYLRRACVIMFMFICGERA
jgi:hypothetical protein